MRKAREKLSRLETVLMIIVMAKLCGNGKKIFRRSQLQGFFMTNSPLFSTLRKPCNELRVANPNPIGSAEPNWRSMKISSSASFLFDWRPGKIAIDVSCADDDLPSSEGMLIPESRAVQMPASDAIRTQPVHA